MDVLVALVALSSTLPTYLVDLSMFAAPISPSSPFRGVCTYMVAVGRQVESMALVSDLRFGNALRRCALVE